MPGLTIGWRYLTGYAAATDPSRRDRAEWPPHPGRVFMALAAAWFETSPPGVGHREASGQRREWDEEGEALQWLESLGDPELCLPPREYVMERSPVKVYVPVNDTADAHVQPDKKKKATIFPHLGSVAIGRSRQPRTFPRLWVGERPCFIHWPAADGVEQHRDALDRLCRKVTRIGHSSSLVQMWVDEGADLARAVNERWEPDDNLGEFQVRKVSAGTLTMLVDQFNQPARQRHMDLSDKIGALEAQKKAAKGKSSKDRGAVTDAEVEMLTKERDAINPRPPLRPTLGLWSGYRQAEPVGRGAQKAHTLFDTDVLVLTHTGGPRLPLSSTLAATQALRDTVMSRGGVQPAPAWVSGHEPNGQPLRTHEAHLACIPLPFVGPEHADGHLLGVGLAFPRAADRRERGRVLGKLLLDDAGKPQRVELKLGQLGVWIGVKREWTETRSALRPETWTGHPDGADTWASVTPVVLDRFPKADRVRDRQAWTNEVLDIIVNACKRIDLPPPVGVDIDTTSWHRGSPRAACKQRPLRGLVGRAGRLVLGDGFPPYPPKGTTSPRPQVHVWLRFAEPVLGPLLLGAGRYLGYGFCKPWAENRA